jgi:hypothetical protein
MPLRTRLIDRPNLQGRELQLFEMLIAIHAKYMFQRHRIFQEVKCFGMTEERIEEIATLSLIHGAPPEIRSRLQAVVDLANARVAGRDTGKSS